MLFSNSDQRGTPADPGPVGSSARSLVRHAALLVRGRLVGLRGAPAVGVADERAPHGLTKRPAQTTMAADLVPL